MGAPEDKNEGSLKKPQLICLSNLLVDVAISATDDDLVRLNVKKGDFVNFQETDSNYFFSNVAIWEKMKSFAGGAANVAFNAASMRIGVALIGTVGDDEFGRQYKQYVRESGIRALISDIKGKTGISYVLITPDGERTFIDDLGVSQEFVRRGDSELIADYLHTSLYELRSPDALAMVYDAHRQGTKISLDLASPGIVSKFLREQKENMEDVLRITDVVFMNEDEAKAITNTKDDIENHHDILEYVFGEKLLALKLGAKGSVIWCKDKKYASQLPEIDSKQFKNTCGAGDAYAAGILFGLIRYLPIETCILRANSFAAKVICKEGPHL